MSESRRCLECSHKFTVCKFNSQRQKYCKRAVCVRVRKKRRQREYHHRRYRSDKTFQEAKRCQSRDYARVRREAAKARSKRLVGDLDPMDILTGVVSQLADEKNPFLLSEILRVYSLRGRQLSQGAVVSGPAP